MCFNFVFKSFLFRNFKVDFFKGGDFWIRNEKFLQINGFIFFDEKTTFL